MEQEQTKRRQRGFLILEQCRRLCFNRQSRQSRQSRQNDVHSPLSTLRRQNSEMVWDLADG